MVKSIYLNVLQKWYIYNVKIKQHKMHNNKINNNYNVVLKITVNNNKIK